jgi:hypothetical protein
VSNNGSILYSWFFNGTSPFQVVAVDETSGFAIWIANVPCVAKCKLQDIIVTADGM